eukprot:COSAG06_NODE_730_length_12734_cov_8.227859_1_plen_44_part_10
MPGQRLAPVSDRRSALDGLGRARRDPQNHQRAGPAGAAGRGAAT